MKTRLKEMQMDNAADRVQLFLSQYRQCLEQAVQAAGIPARLVEEYAFVDCLAEGEEKEIYTLRRKMDGKLCLLRVSWGKERENAAAEAQNLEKIRHPAIPRLMEWIHQGDRAYLVREYFQGPTLARQVHNQGTMPPEEVLRLAGEMAEILHYIHSRTPPVIHRDIKPENIVLDPGGGVRLIDFGIAREYRWNENRDTRIFGTDLYAPPEQFGYRQTGPYSDIYSLGMVLLYLATGGLDRFHLKQGVPHKGLRELIATCTAFAPENRYHSARELRRGIRRARHWRVGSVCRVAGKVLAAALVAALVAGAILVGWTLWALTSQ